MTFQRIVVLGAGAVGSAYGALLSRRNDVLLVGRAEHVRAINASGLVVEEDEKGIYRLPAVTSLKEIPQDTLILVATKAYDLADSLKSIRDLIRKDTVVLLLQNGLGIEETASKALKGRGEIIRGLATLASEMLAPGRIRYWKGQTILGPGTTAARIAQVLEDSGLAIRVASDFAAEVWKKLVVNCVINPLTAILRARDSEIGGELLAGIRHAVVREVLAVGVAEGITLKSDLVDFVDQLIPRYENRSSMLQDVTRGNRTEIDSINGKVVELGKRHGIPTPANDCLTQLVRFLEVRHR
jgi:2-dehydropantoate 2-reductase